MGFSQGFLGPLLVRDPGVAGLHIFSQRHLVGSMIAPDRVLISGRKVPRKALIGQPGLPHSLLPGGKGGSLIAPSGTGSPPERKVWSLEDGGAGQTKATTSSPLIFRNYCHNSVAKAAPGASSESKLAFQTGSHPPFPRPFLPLLCPAASI